MPSHAVKRLRSDIAKLAADPPEFIWARYKESNVFLWSFLLAPPSDSVYGVGWYWGRLKFPSEYPMAPPSILMVTPSGRFATETKICLSISDFHPETWNPTLQVSTILKGVLSFMLGEETTTGAVWATDLERRRLAQLSVEWNKRQPEFNAVFPDFDELRAAEQARRAAMQRAQESVRCEILVARGDFERALQSSGVKCPSAIAAAQDAKLSGDAKFRAGDYSGALVAYSAAPAVGCAALLRNRAAAYEKLGDFESVVRDCDAAIKIDKDVGEPPSFKALARRANAYERLGRPLEAVADIELALRTADDSIPEAKLLDLRSRLEQLNLTRGARDGEVQAATKKKKNRRKHKHAAPQAVADKASAEEAAANVSACEPNQGCQSDDGNQESVAGL